jgi:hypothetical protein
LELKKGYESHYFTRNSAPRVQRTNRWNILDSADNQQSSRISDGFAPIRPHGMLTGA